MKTGLEGLEESVLPLVAKPGRYVAPPGLRVFSDFDHPQVRICVIYPESFEIATSAPLLHAVLARLARLQETRPGTFLYDLAAAPEGDLLALLAEEGLPPFSLAHRQPLSRFDVLVVLATGILSTSRALRLIALSGVPITATERTDGHPLVLLAGDAAWYPNALAAYVDAFLLGDPEVWLEDLFACFGRQERSAAERRETLFRLSEFEGTLVPLFPPAGRAPGGRWLSQLPPVDNAGLLPLVETAAEATVIEVARPMGPVCPASPPRSTRFRGVEETLRAAASLLEQSGDSELFLAGEGAERHPALGSLLEALNLRFAPEGVHVRMGDVDPGCFTSAVARELQKARRADLHFSPVPVSERLREQGGRSLSRTGLSASIAMALRGDWAGVRVGFVLGVPGETEDDRREGLEVLEELSTHRTKNAKRPHLSVGIRPFVPVGHGSGESHPCLTTEQWSVIAGYWRHRLQRSKIRVVSPAGTALEAEAALRLGGLRAGALLPEIGTWWEGLPPDPESAAHALGERWAAVKPRLETFGSESGAGDKAFAVSLVGESLDEPETLVTTERIPTISRPGPEEGRRPRREGRPRDVRQSDRFRLRTAKDEHVRFISHLDVTRAYFRAFRRSQLPVAITGGRDRRQKIAFGPPLPLGMTSGAEFIDVAFVKEVPESFVASLNESLPEGLSVVASAPVRTEPDSLSSVIQIATYEVSFPDSIIRRYLADMPFDELRARLEDRVASVTASSRLDITKGRGNDRKTFNARPSMLRAEVVRDDGGRPVLSLALTLNRPDSARPELWTAALLNWAHVDERLLRVHRSGLYIPGRQSWLDPLDVVAPGFEWWRQPVRGGTVP
ncbi:MAG TPA: TIGR03936 family radical SAM-associated protein [Candidatus Eisenbacteria bacterium]|nr:TIGR03936 family radical SAM-associated protein [Candidatus Eisenbacteria bacterium]